MSLQTHMSLIPPREFINAFPDAIECGISLGENTTGTALAFNARGDMLAVGCYDGSVKIIDFLTREIIRELAAATDKDLETSENAKREEEEDGIENENGGDGNDSKWKVFKPDEECEGHSAIICSVSWCSGNRKMLTAAYDNRIILWDVLSQKPEKAYSFDTTVTRAEVNLKYQEYCLVSLYNDIPHIVNMNTNEILRVDIGFYQYSQKNKQDMITAKFWNDGLKFYVGNSIGQITIFQEMDAKDGAGKVQFEQADTFNVSPENASIKAKSSVPVLGIQCSRHNNFYLINSDSRLKLYHSASNTQQAEFRDAVQQQLFSYCCFSGLSGLQRDSNWDSEYVVGCSENKIYIWDIITQQLQKILEGPKEKVICVDWHPYRPIIASSTIGGFVYVWTKTPEGNYSAFDPDFAEIEANDTYLEREDEFDEDYRQRQEKLIEVRKQQMEEEDCGFVDVVTVEKSPWEMDLSDNEVYLTRSPIPDSEMRRQRRFELIQQKKQAAALERGKNKRKRSKKSSAAAKQSTKKSKASKKETKRKSHVLYEDDASHSSDRDSPISSIQKREFQEQVIDNEM